MAMRAADLATPPDRAMLDTNVLLAATDEGRAEHDQALEIVNDWPGRGTTLYTSGQIMREYLAVATRPAERNGLGLKLADALANVRAFRGRTSSARRGRQGGRPPARLAGRHRMRRQTGS